MTVRLSGVQCDECEQRTDCDECSTCGDNICDECAADHVCDDAEMMGRREA